MPPDGAEERLVVKLNGHTLFAMYGDGMVLAPGTIDRPLVQALLVQALAMVTPAFEHLSAPTLSPDAVMREGLIAFARTGEPPFDAPQPARKPVLHIVSSDPDQST